MGSGTVQKAFITQRGKKFMWILKDERNYMAKM